MQQHDYKQEDKQFPSMGLTKIAQHSHDAQDLPVVNVLFQVVTLVYTLLPPLQLPLMVRHKL